MQTTIIGTTAILLANANPRRRRWALQFIPSSIQAGNTGKIFVAKGALPVATIGDPNMGQVLNSGAAIEEVAKYPDDPSVWKGAIWAISDTASQQCMFEEQLTGE